MTNPEKHFHFAPQTLAEISTKLLEQARAFGATDAIASIAESDGINTNVRQGRILARSRERRSSVSLTVYVGQRQGSVRSTDVSESSLEEVAKAACAIARHTEEDPFAGLPEAERLCQQPRSLELFHPWSPAPAELIEMAHEIEAGVQHPLCQSDGAWIGARQQQFWISSSRGFSHGYAESSHSLTAAVIAASAEVRMLEFWSSESRRQEGLEPARSVGRKATDRAVALLDQQPVVNGVYPVLFDPPSATSMLEHLAQAISGRALYMRSSFLADRFESLIFPRHISIDEDPFIAGGLASAPYDAEGVEGSQRALVREGRLEGALLGSYSARRLGRRGTGNGGGSYNLRLSSTHTQPTNDLQQMLETLGTGLLVTGLSGDGVHLISGDYSRPVRGFWVENGEIVHAVDGATIAGNLLEMWAQIVAVGAETHTQGPFTSGAILVEKMRLSAQ